MIPPELSYPRSRSNYRLCCSCSPTSKTDLVVWRRVATKGSPGLIQANSCPPLALADCCSGAVSVMWTDCTFRPDQHRLNYCRKSPKHCLSWLMVKDIKGTLGQFRILRLVVRYSKFRSAFSVILNSNLSHRAQTGSPQFPVTLASLTLSLCNGRRRLAALQKHHSTGHWRPGHLYRLPASCTLDHLEARKDGHGVLAHLSIVFWSSICFRHLRDHQPI